MSYLEFLKSRGKQNREKLIENIIKSRRFAIETNHQKRLYTALRWTNQKEIFETTLLAPKIHTKHCIQLRNKLLKKWTAIRNKARSKLLERIQIAEGLTKKLKGVGKFERQIVSDSDIANEHLRFFTLIDSVVPLDSFEAIIPIIKMKEEIIEAVNKTKGINCIGAISPKSTLTSLSFLTLLNRKTASKLFTKSISPVKPKLLAVAPLLPTIKSILNFLPCVRIGRILSSPARS